MEDETIAKYDKKYEGNSCANLKFVFVVCVISIWNLNLIYICKNSEPLIYISINIYRVHCGKGSTRKFTSNQSNLDKLVISSIY